MCVSVQVDRPAYIVPLMSLHIQVHQCLMVLQLFIHISCIGILQRSVKKWEYSRTARYT